jgi:hypothetical protein
VDFLVAATAPTTTAGYDAYWRFATERQNVYLRRIAGHTGPLTDDPVLCAHRFTNAYRAADRVSQHLITDVLYDRDWNWVDTFARTLVFKVFNRISTWEHIVGRLGDVDADTVASGAVEAVVGEVADGQPVYSAAYIMPPPQDRTGPKYVRHLSLIRTMLAEGVPDRIADATGMADAYEILAGYPSVGPFLAYQFVTDLNYSAHLSFSEAEFVVPGPGAVRGLKKCFSDPGGYSLADLIRRTANVQRSEFARRELDWHNLWGRDLQFVDAQNLFCEVDKYTRVAYPELSAYATGTRIKQRYRRDHRPVTAWFPPKWCINENVAVLDQQAEPRVDGQLVLI